ncbi:hypothetical protein C8J56DRAFT_949187 [Mycena floridula]|nr:hypothetical protein C8J56DRAFT_949187 [Mycena floridula]
MDSSTNLIFASDTSTTDFLELYKANVIPLRACLAGLAWILHDYFLTIEDEIRYIWPQRGGLGRTMFLFIRYYTILIVIFDVAQIHTFAIPGIPGPKLCVAMDSIIRVIGAISLWAVEIIMQLRIYALYNGSRKVALFNAGFFALSIFGFFGILIRNAMVRKSLIEDVIALPLPGCPSIHSGLEWAQWVPAAGFEVILCGFALFKSIRGIRDSNSFGLSLYAALVRDNLLYFLGITVILLFNNFMVLGITHIPWFSYTPFHAVVSILTTRMLINLRKTAEPKNSTIKSQIVELDFVFKRTATQPHASEEEV